MSKRLPVTSLLLLGGLLIAAHGAAAANPGADVTLSPDVEAWYQANPSCQLATGCVTPDVVPGGLLPVPAPTALPVYPSGTLHIGFASGQETARSYLLFPFDDVVGTVTSARLTIPLDTAQVDGSVTPESSHVQVCLAIEPVGRAEASLNNPPATSCSRHVNLSYVATPAPHLQGDLSALLPDLTTASGLALVPDASNALGAWHVVFKTHTADAKGAAMLEVADRTGPLAGGPLSQSAGPPGAVALQPGPAAQLAPGLRPVGQQAPSGVLPQVEPAPTSVALAPAAQQGAPFLKLPALAAHPAVWLLPPALILLLMFLSNALRRDLSTRHVAENTDA